jgi:ubiquinone/menaquinone biosynthesis C-methylase UbiE
VHSLKATIKELNHLLGNIDIYLLDQVLKGRFPKNYTILDAGCGEGRNLVFFIRNGYKVFGIDKNEDAINMLRYLSKSINPEYTASRFRAGDVLKMPYKDQQFDAIISSAVLHFAENEQHFLEMFSELDRVLKSAGVLFARMATIVGIEHSVKALGDGKYLLPDGSVRFLLTNELLDKITTSLGYDLIEPFKTVVVHHQRCMSTLVLKKK